MLLSARSICEAKPLQAKHYITSAVIFATTFIAGTAALQYLIKKDFTNIITKQYPETWLQCCILILISTIITYLVMTIFDPRPSHLMLRSSLRVIPTWITVASGLIWVAIIDIVLSGPKEYATRSFEWILYAAFPISLATVIKWSENRTTLPKRDHEERHDKRSSSDYSKPAHLSDYSMLNDAFNSWWNQYGKWITNDDPTEDDLLGVGMDSVASRIHDSLRMDSGPRSIGVIGKYGSGKSSMLRRVESQSANEKSRAIKLVFCNFSCWGIENSDKAISELIDQAVDSLADEVDVFKVRSLGKKYRDNMTIGDNYLDRITSFLWGETSFDQMFSELSMILELARIRLVFVIEDLDRNKDDHFDAQRIISFLFSLKEHQSFRFILAADVQPKSSIKIDFMKVCDRVEYIRSPDIIQGFFREFRG